MRASPPGMTSYPPGVATAYTRIVSVRGARRTLAPARQVGACDNDTRSCAT